MNKFPPPQTGKVMREVLTGVFGQPSRNNHTVHVVKVRLGDKNDNFNGYIYTMGAREGAGILLEPK